MWQALAPYYAVVSNSCWSKAAPVIKFATCLERNHLFHKRPGPKDMCITSWPRGRPAEAMDIVRELMTPNLHGLQPDEEIASALARWVNHVPALRVPAVLTRFHTW